MKIGAQSNLALFVRFIAQIRSLLSAALAALIMVSCTKEPQSATDPFPLPSGTEAGKDLSIKPGDSFYDYCNGTWLKNTPIPATSAVDLRNQPAIQLLSRMPIPCHILYLVIDLHTIPAPHDIWKERIERKMVYRYL